MFIQNRHTDRYLPHHQFHVKRGVVHCLVKRAEENSSDDQTLKEMKPSHQKNKEHDQEEERKPLTTAVIPYSQGLSEQIRRVLKMFNIRTAFRSGASLGKLLTKVEDPVPQEDRPGCLCGDS